MALSKKDLDALDEKMVSVGHEVLKLIAEKFGDNEHGFIQSCALVSSINEAMQSQLKIVLGIKK